MFYILGLCILWLNQSATLKDLDEKLSAAAVKIEYAATADTVFPPMPESTATHDLENDDLLTEIEVDEVKAIPPQAHTSDVFQDEPEKDSPATNAAPLASAPILDIAEESPTGLLPKVSSAGLKPFDAYKRPMTSLGKDPVAALVIKDFGLSDAASEKLASALPADITFILSPYSKNPDDWQKAARQAGHEIWLGLPFETRSFPMQDPGPLGILNGESLDYNTEALLSTLGKASGYAGIATFTDETFVNSRLLLQNLLRMVFERGLGFFEGNPDGLIMIEDFAATSEAPYVRNSAAIEGMESSAVKKIADMAKTQGFVVATIEATTGNLEALQSLIKDLQAAGIRLVPLSYIAQPPSD